MATTGGWTDWCTTGSGATDTVTWRYWLNTGTTGTVIADSWRVWNTTTTAATSTIWYDWTNATGSRYVLRTAVTTEAEEERAARLEAARVAALERARAEEARRVTAEAALARAEELLLEHLTAKQKRQYRRERAFCVRGSLGREYRIRLGTGSGTNVDRLDERGQAVETYCTYAKEQVPEPDRLLAQKLLIEHAEEEFCRLAPRPVRAR